MEIETKERKGPKRILLDVTDDLHAIIKGHAAFKHMTMRKWIVRAIVKQIAEEDKFK